MCTFSSIVLNKNAVSTIHNVKTCKDITLIVDRKRTAFEIGRGINSFFGRFCDTLDNAVARCLQLHHHPIEICDLVALLAEKISSCAQYSNRAQYGDESGAGSNSNGTSVTRRKIIFTLKR